MSQNTGLSSILQVYQIRLDKQLRTGLHLLPKQEFLVIAGLIWFMSRRSTHIVFVQCATRFMPGLSPVRAGVPGEGDYFGVGGAISGGARHFEANRDALLVVPQ